jgi:hypothetical protein
MALGSLLTSYERTTMAARAADGADADDRNAEMLSQLKDIRESVKDIDTLLQTGSARVVVVINPDSNQR